MTTMIADYSRGVLGMIRRMVRGVRRDEGGSLVEMALVSAFIYMPMLFGLFQVSYGLYIYNYVCSAAHQATRYAAVRSSNSCIIESDFVDCDLNPAGSTNAAPLVTGTTTPLQSYVQKLAAAGINPTNLTVTATWYKERFTTSSGFSVADWSQPCGNTAACMIGGTANGYSNDIGNVVQVSVVYQFPLNIPFLPQKSLPITGVSQMMISE
jgi:Flp pilus assembly protein TadG